jgi:Arc/MetJ family transcription regulator
MRRTVVIDDNLLDEAQRALGTSGIRETVEAGLREAIRRRRLQELRDAMGTFDLDLTAEDLQRLRNAELPVFGRHVRLVRAAFETAGK